MNRSQFLALAAQSPRKRIACLSSTYHVRSHSDNFITRFLEGYWIGETHHDPPFEVASLWMDQIHPADIGHRLAAEKLPRVDVPVLVRQLDHVGVGYSHADIHKITGLKLLRVLRQNEEVAKQK